MWYLHQSTNRRQLFNSVAVSVLPTLLSAARLARLRNVSSFRARAKRALLVSTLPDEAE